MKLINMYAMNLRSYNPEQIERSNQEGISSSLEKMGIIGEANGLRKVNYRKKTHPTMVNK